MSHYLKIGSEVPGSSSEPPGGTGWVSSSAMHGGWNLDCSPNLYVPQLSHQQNEGSHPQKLIRHSLLKGFLMNPTVRVTVKYYDKLSFQKFILEYIRKLV